MRQLAKQIFVNFHMKIFFFNIIAFDGKNNKKFTFFNWNKKDYESNFKDLTKTYKIKGIQARLDKE